MASAYLIAGIAAFVTIPLVSAFLFILGFGGIVNAMASNEYEEDGGD